MSLDFIWPALEQIGKIYLHQIPIMLGLGALFALLSIFRSQASSPGKVWWRNPGAATDFSYALIHAIVGPYLKIPALVLVYGVLLLTAGMSSDQVAAFFENGGGPLSHLPFWAQVIAHLLISDILLYWIHRKFHESSMWRYHAIHHSATQVDWTTNYRSHPVNVVLQSSLVTVLMLAFGISPAVMAFLVPFDLLMSAWVHANLNWTLGPLKYVVATPVFHRWHHTMPEEGGNSNFAPTFSFLDVLFGTFYMPQGKLPQTFGNDDPHFPEGYFRQLVHPLRGRRQETVPVES